MKVRNGITTAILCVVMLMTSAIVVSAADVYTYESFKYTINDNSVSIVEYIGSDKKVEVPDSITGVPVNTIAKGAFAGTGVTSVVLPETVMTIEQGAFDSKTTISYIDSSGKKTVVGKSSKDISYYSVLPKGEKTYINDRELTVTKEGKSMVDQDGNKYTIDKKGNIKDSNGDIVLEAVSVADMIDAGVITDPTQTSEQIGGANGDATDTDSAEHSAPMSKTMKVVIALASVLALSLVAILVIMKRRKKK